MARFWPLLKRLGLAFGLSHIIYIYNYVNDFIFQVDLPFAQISFQLQPLFGKGRPNFTLHRLTKDVKASISCAFGPQLIEAKATRALILNVDIIQIAADCVKGQLVLDWKYTLTRGS